MKFGRDSCRVLLNIFLKISVILKLFGNVFRTQSNLENWYIQDEHIFQNSYFAFCYPFNIVSIDVIPSAKTTK